MKLSYHYDHNTLIFTGTSKVFKCAGYDHYILPQFATWTELPEHDSENEQCHFQLDTNSWVVEPKFAEATAYHKQTQQEKKFDDISLITEDYTPDKPSSPFDEWTPTGWQYSQEKERPHKEADERRWRDTVLDAALKRISQYERDQSIDAQYRTSPLTVEQYQGLLADRKLLCDYPSVEGFPFCSRPVLSAMGQALSTNN